jgi:hypothetical protein
VGISPSTETVNIPSDRKELINLIKFVENLVYIICITSQGAML